MTLDTAHLVFLLAGITLVAFLYSSVGHAGASGYIAVMTLCGLSATLQEIFEVTQLPRILNLYQEEQEAVQSFAT